MWLCATNLGAQLCVDGWIAPPVQCWFRQLLNLGIGSLKYREKTKSGICAQCSADMGGGSTCMQSMCCYGMCVFGAALKESCGPS